MTYTYTDTELPQFETLPEADCQFEVISVERGISRGGKTGGCDQIELGLTLSYALIGDSSVKGPKRGYVNVTFTLPDEKTDPKTAQFLRGKFDQFLKASSAVTNKGDVVNIDSDEFFLGLRGWLHNQHRTYKNSEQKDVTVNDVAYFVTDKPRIARAPKVLPANEEMNSKRGEWD